MAWKDSGGADRADASGELLSSVHLSPCSKKGCKDRAEVGSHVACADCGRVYTSCAKHGGLLGSKRSLHSHRALYHPRNEAP